MQYYRVVTDETIALDHGRPVMGRPPIPYDDMVDIPLPSPDQPGEWTPPLKYPVQVGYHGYHLVPQSRLVHWLYAEAIYEAEGRGESDICPTLAAYQQIRLLRRMPWSQRTACQFGLNCARQVLLLDGGGNYDYGRLLYMLRAAERYLNGSDSRQEVIEALGIYDAPVPAWSPGYVPQAVEMACMAVVRYSPRLVDEAAQLARHVLGEPEAQRQTEELAGLMV